MRSSRHRLVVLGLLAPSVAAGCMAPASEPALDTRSARLLEATPPEALWTVGDAGVGLEHTEGRLVDLDVGASAFAISAEPGRVIVFGLDGGARLTLGTASAGPIALSRDGSEVWLALSGGILRRVAVPSGVLRSEWALEDGAEIADLVVRDAEVLVLTDSGEVRRLDFEGQALEAPSPTWTRARALVSSVDGVVRVLDQEAAALLPLDDGAAPIPLPEPLADAARDACHGRVYGLTADGSAWIAVDEVSGEVVHREPWDGAQRGLGVLSAAPEHLVVARGAEEPRGASVFRFEPVPLAFVESEVPPAQVGQAWSWQPSTNRSPDLCGPQSWSVEGLLASMALDASTGALSFEPTCAVIGLHELVLHASDGAVEATLTVSVEVVDGDEDADAVPDCADTCPGLRDLLMDLDGDGQDDACDQDLDGDGLDNATEATLGSNPRDADSDDDGLPDGEEQNPDADPDADHLANIVDPDSDDDGLLDGDEAMRGTNPESRDTDQDAYLDNEEVMWGTDPLNPASPGVRFVGASSKPVDEAEEGCSVGGRPGRQAPGALWGVLLAGALMGLVWRRRAHVAG